MVGLGRGYVRPYRRLAQHAPALRSISPLGLSENVFRDFFNLLEPTEEEVARRDLQTGHFLVNAIETDSAYELAIQLPGLNGARTHDSQNHNLELYQLSRNCLPFIRKSLYL